MSSRRERMMQIKSENKTSWVVRVVNGSTTLQSCDRTYDEKTRDNDINMMRKFAENHGGDVVVDTYAGFDLISTKNND